MFLKQGKDHWALLTDADRKSILPVVNEGRLLELGKALSCAMGAKHMDIRRDSESGAITKIIWRRAA